MLKISIHALREESDQNQYILVNADFISIHALREESDTPTASNGGVYALFQSTLSVRRATSFVRLQAGFNDYISIHALREESDYPQIHRYTDCQIFQSTLSVRRATHHTYQAYRQMRISIHALREESDGSMSFALSNS